MYLSKLDTMVKKLNIYSYMAEKKDGIKKTNNKK